MGHVGEEVRRLREAREWTQPRLAVESGIAVSGISLIENGHRNPNAGTLTKLARALGVEVADLFPKAEAPLPLEFYGGGAGQTERAGDVRIIGSVEELMSLALGEDEEGRLSDEARVRFALRDDDPGKLWLWRQYCENLADGLEELTEGAETVKWERRFGRAEGTAFAATGAISVIEALVKLLELGAIPAPEEEVRGLLRAGFRLAKAADRVDELATPDEEDLMEGVRRRQARTLTEIRFRKITEGLELTAEDREEIFA